MTAHDATNNGLNETALLFKHTARRLFHESCPVDRLHRQVATAPSPMPAPACVWDRALWQSMVQLGWPAMAVPERADGAAVSAVAVMAVVEELGRAAAPSPLIATLGAAYVLAACETAPADAALRRIAAGTPVGLALADAHGAWAIDDASVTARITATGDAVLDGTAWFVQDAGKCELLVVKARTPRGIGLYVIDVRAPGVTIIPDAIHDLTRDQAHVVLDHVPPVAIAAAPGHGAPALARAEPALLLLVTADIVGAAEWQLATTVDYARTRVQFDRPIGAFQAVKHPLVDMMLMIDQSRALLYSAARALDRDDGTAAVLARMAKARASDTAAYCAGCSVQLHGGIGFTWESYVHLYFKRQKHNEVLLGDSRYHRARLADLLIGPASNSRPDT